MHVIDQFITGLNNYDLQKHVQFGHPKTLNEAISLATEYEALEGSVDRIKKPKADVETVAPIMTHGSDKQFAENITMQQLDKLIEKKLNLLTASSRSRSKSPSANFKQEQNATKSEPKSSAMGKQTPKSELYCNYCKRNNHNIENCRTRKYHEKRRAEQPKQPGSDAAYLITTQEKQEPIPEILVTPSVEIADQDPMDEPLNTSEIQAEESRNDQSKTDISEEEILQPILTNQIYTDISETQTNVTRASCLYLNAAIFTSQLKLLLDTGSPYSILSLKCFQNLEGKNKVELTKEAVKLTAADGSHLDISGKAQLEFQAEGVTFKQEFIIAKIKGIAGILGMDFLTAYGGDIKIKKQVLKTVNGRLQLHKQTSQTCARIVIADKTDIPANTEVLVSCKVDQPAFRTERTCTVEPANYLTRKGCFVARTLVDPDCENVVLSLVNLGDQAVKINQNSVLGRLEDVEEVYAEEPNTTIEMPHTEKLPDHLQTILANTSSKLTETERQKLSETLLKYEDTFMKPDGELGQTDIVEHEIDTGDHKPIKIPPRRVPLFKRQQVDEELEKMLAQGIVEPSDSPWSAPICLVKKKDGSCRFCIDFRRLNSVTVKDAYPLPRIDDTLDALSESMWFSTLDLASGYWQIKLSEASKKKSAFVTPHRGLYHFNVMPFGLTNAPATFQRLMEKVLFSLTPEKCLCYLDDIIILGRTFDQALENLELVLQRIRNAHLKLKPKKCVLFQTSVTYLGHVVSEDGISSDPSKVEAVKNWPSPTNKSEVRSILGLMGYYRKFISNFASRASPLTKLTRKRARFEWNEEHETAFQDLKECLVNCPVLAIPNNKDMFVLDCDASLHGLGGVLSQIQNGNEKVIAYASRTLNSAQQQYCTTKRELLAVVTLMKHFKHYLLGQKFIIRTDHAPLIWLRNFKEPEGLIARWISIIETYNYTIQYRPGRQK